MLYLQGTNQGGRSEKNQTQGENPEHKPEKIQPLRRRIFCHSPSWPCQDLMTLPGYKALNAAELAVSSTVWLQEGWLQQQQHLDAILTGCNAPYLLAGVLHGLDGLSKDVVVVQDGEQDCKDTPKQKGTVFSARSTNWYICMQLAHNLRTYAT